MICLIEFYNFAGKTISTMKENILHSDNSIQDIIYDIRGVKVMLDYDLASMYEVAVSQLKRQVRRNIDRFPEDFMFELTSEEVSALRCQNGILKTGRGQHSKYLPFAFTEERVAMLSGVLRSKVAVQVNINIMRAFFAVRQAIAALQSSELRYEQLSHQVDQLNAHVEKILHDQDDINQMQSQFNNEVALQIEVINDALDQLREKNDEPSNPIGFRV